MGSSSSVDRAEARIRQLCCLGLGGEVIMPALLRELHQLIPSYGNCFFWADDNARLVDMYDEQALCVSLLPEYLDHYYNRRDKEVHRGFTYALRHYRGVIGNEEFFTVDTSTMLASDFYNCIMRPQHNRYFIKLYVREAGKPLGMLQMHRDCNERPFDSRDRLRLARMQPYLAHALAPCPQGEIDEWVDSGESGLIITDRLGRPVSFSPMSRRLLHLASNRRTQANARRIPHVRLPRVLESICGNLTEIFAGDTTAESPTVIHRNAWGVFIFRAYWLDSATPGDGRIGITVSRQTPLALGLLQGARRMPLSHRQSEVAVLLAAGLSKQQTADRLGVSLHTVIAHGRWVYDRLGVHDRGALRTRLLRAGREKRPQTM